jgi:hypothetical protein
VCGEVILSFYQNKNFWAAIIIFLPLLMVAVYYGLGIITSIYKTDFGSGVVIYADDYVKTGNWVFYCNKSRLISRQPLPEPIAQLEASDTLTIGGMYLSKDTEKNQAVEAIRALVEVAGWYNKLNYRYSILGEYSYIEVHVFGFLGRHNGRSGALKVSQLLNGRSKSSFKIIAEPYDPETYMDHSKMLQVAAKSCPVPQ